MMRDLGTYQTQIARFVNVACREHYANSQPEDREDLAIEISLIALRQRSKTEGLSETKFLAWLHGTATNVTRNWSRREGTVAKNTRGSLDDVHLCEGCVKDSPLESHTPETDILAQEKQEMVRKAVSQLSPNRQQVIRLFYADGLSEAEIAGQLGVKLGTVKSRLNRAREALRPNLERYFQP